MSDAKNIEVERFVAAPAEKIFAVLADPQRQIAIDGSGMLRGAQGGPVTQVGQSFVMDMYRDDLGHYRTVNTVTEYESGSSLGWAPALDVSHSCPLVTTITESGMTTGGHTYTYRLRPVDGGTQVTQTYDWSGVKDPQFATFCPLVTHEELDGTLANLARAVES